jgi:hypothetical protein
LESGIISTVRKKISIPCYLNGWDQNNHAVIKSDPSGKKSRYICGVSTGIAVDKHGEHLTKSAVESIMRQANSQDILLYNDIHGIRDNEDIGILTKGAILPNGDFHTEYRLYDEADDLGDEVVEKNNKLWKKMLGLPPYTRKRQKGFSIEGYVPEDKILSYEMDEYGHAGKRVIDDIVLEGVVLVPKPAYNSVASAVMKCLDILPPEVETKVKKNFNDTLQGILADRTMADQYFRKKNDIEYALQEAIEKVMKDGAPNKEDRLKIIFDEYVKMMTPLIMNSQNLFREDEGDEIEESLLTKSIESEKISVLVKSTLSAVMELKQKISKGDHTWVTK